MTIFVSIDSMTELTAVTPVTTDAEGQRLPSSLLMQKDSGYSYTLLMQERSRKTSVTPVTTNPEGQRLSVSLLIQKDIGYPYHY